MQLEKGKAFQGIIDESPKGEFYKHLRIVISDVNAETGRALAIPISTVHSERIKYDDSCLLFKGEHEFLTEEKSYANYARANAISQKDINELKQRNKLIEYKDVSEELLKRLQEGARKTEFLEMNLVKYFADF